MKNDPRFDKKGGDGICKYYGEHHSNAVMHWKFCSKKPQW